MRLSRRTLDLYPGTEENGDSTAHSSTLSTMDANQNAPAGSLSWRLSSHPITLLCFLTFRICKFLHLGCPHPFSRQELDTDWDGRNV
jgi:hypothetical protein